MSFLFQVARRARWLLALFLAVEVAGSAAGAAEPSYLQAFMSTVLDGLGAGGTLQPVGGILLALAALHIAGAACLGASSYLMSVVSARLLKDLRSAFFMKMSRLPISYFREVSQGEFVTQFNMDLHHAEQFLGEMLPQALLNVLMGLGVMAILAITCNPLLTLLGVLVALASSVLVVWLNQRLQHLAEALRDNYAEINRVFDETVQGIDTLKVFGGEGMQAAKFDHFNEMFRSLSVASGRLAAMFLPAVDMVLKLGNLAILALVYSMLARGTLDRDAFLRFFFYLAMLQGSLNALIGLATNLQPTLVSLRRLRDVFGQEEEEGFAQGAGPAESPWMGAGPGGDAEDPHGEWQEQSGPQGPHSAPPPVLRVDIENLSFAFPGGRPLFHEASLSLPAGTATHLQGDSGAGKTTLINLLLRFYRPEGGCIRFNGEDIEGMPLAAVRDQVSVVTQDHFVFEEPLRENLALGGPYACDEEMIDALRKANLGAWFDRLPEGLDTVMGTRGKSISGGERQRLCIARAFLKHAPLVVLDEPFANVDGGTRDELLKAIVNLRREATLLIVSHQPVDDAVVDRRVILDPTRSGFVPA